MTVWVKKNGAWEEVFDLHSLAGGSFRRALTAYVKNGGVWKQVYTYVPTMPTTTTVSSVSTTTPTAPSTTVTISGSVLRTSDSTPVPTGSTVELWNGGVKLSTTTTNASGNWSFSFTPTTTGAYNLTVKFVENGFYTASQANVSTITASASTTTSITVPGNTVINTNFTISGTISSSTGETPANGTVTIQYSTDNLNWSSGGITTSSGGAFSFTTLQWATPQQTVYWRAVYSATGNFLTSNSSSSTVWFMRPTPGTPTLTATSLTHSGFTLNFSASDATSYDIYKNSVFLTNTAATTYAVTGLAEDTSTTWYVVAKNENTVDGSTTSATKTYNTGHAAITDSGTNVAFTFNAAETNSWRATDDWGYLGTDLAQGYFSANPYTGVARFDYGAMRAAIDAYGTDRANRWTHVTCTKIEVYLTRQTGSGSSAAVPISWYMSTTNPGNVNAEPNRTFGPDTASPSGLATGDSGWLTLPDDTWGDKLLDGTYISLAMYHNGSANYSQYNGGTGFKVRVTYSWNYTFRTLVSPTFV